MTPTPKPSEWWQTILISAANIVVAALVQHFLGNAAAAGTIAAGTAAAHLAQSPLRK